MISMVANLASSDEF